MNIIFGLIKEKRKKFILSTLFAATGAILNVVPYLLIYGIIVMFLNEGIKADTKRIYYYIGIALGAIVIRYILTITSFVFSHIAAFDLLYSIRIKLTRHLGSLPMGYWSKNSSGKVLKIIQEDVERIENFVAHHIPDTVSGLVLPVATIVALFFVNWRMALVTMIPIPLGFLMIRLMFSGIGTGQDRKSMWESYHKAIERMHSTIVEFVQGMPVVKAFGITVDSFNRLKSAIVDYKEFTVSLSKSQTPYYAVFTAIILGGGLFIIPFGIYFLKNGMIDTATFLLFLILGTGCFSNFVKIMTIAKECEMVFESGKRIGTILGEKILEEPENSEIPERSNIEIRNLSFRYTDEGPYVLKNINLNIPEHSFTAVVGESGAGKTTLVQLISRMWDVEEGEILIGGKNLKSIGTPGVNKTVGMVFQDVQMLTDTVRSNIAMNNPFAPDEEIEFAAKTAHCHDFIKNLPKGYDTVIGEGGEVHLSGGEKQRIAIARVIMKNSPVILLDEASCYADAESEVKIQHAFSNAMKNKTVIVIAHRLSTIVHADNIIVVDDGEIKEQGTHKNLLSQNGIYTKMWNAHSKARGWKLDDRKMEKVA